MTSYSSTFRDNRAGRTMLRAFLRVRFNLKPAEIGRILADHADALRDAQARSVTVADLACALSFVPTHRKSQQ